MTTENINPEELCNEEPTGDMPDLMAGEHQAALSDSFGNRLENPSQADAAESRATSTGKPDFLPEKFWDAGKGEVRMEALANSYRELERRLSRKATDRQTTAGSEVPERYEIRADHGLFAQDEAVDERLKAAGLNQTQAQAVYDLAAEVLFPAFTDLSDTVIDRLNQYRLVENSAGKHGGNPTGKSSTDGREPTSPERPTRSCRQAMKAYARLNA